MPCAHKISGSARPWARTLLVAVVTALGLVVGSPTTASAQPVTYSATVTVPAPPASNFAGASGGGDGWAVGLTSTQVFNVFHHNGSVVVNCHNQSDATTCWDNPKVVVDGAGGGFSNSIGPGLYVDQGTGLMYTPAVRNADKVAGIVCIDTTKPNAATGAELFCGFTALTGANESDGQFLSAPVQIGSRWYTFNEWVGAPTSAGQDALLCFDLNAKAACAGQPFVVDRGGIDFQGYTFSFPIAAVGTRVVMQLFGSAGNGLACFDTATSAECSGTWPVTVGSSNGPPLPLLNANSQVIGVCSSNGMVPCFDLSGASTPTPAGFAVAMAVNEVYGSSASVIGPRIYVTHPSSNQVACWDFAQAATCTNFPKTLSNLSLLYSTNPDPARPSCLWVNADGGTSQIQNFDAFTGGPCGAGAIRVLTSSIVVPSDQCIPASYTSLQVLTPSRSGYSTGDIDFQDQSGTPIAGVPQHHVDGTGTTSLSDLNLATTTPLPQFLISLNNPTSAIGSVQVKLVWTGQASPSCVGPGIVASGPPGIVASGTQGYRLGAADGGVFAFGASAFSGSLGAHPVAAPVVGMTTTPSGLGYWLVGSDGGIFAFGDAHYLGSLPGLGIHTSHIRGIARTPSGLGYWLVADDGGVFAFGDAPFLGSLPGFGVVTTGIRGIAASQSGNGFWLVSDDGGIFAFGSAPYAGSLPGLGIHRTDAVGLAAARGGGPGYWIVTKDASIFSFGGAMFAGSGPGLGLGVTDAIGLLSSPSGAGYWVARSAGAVNALGDATFLGGLAVSSLNKPVTAITA